MSENQGPPLNAVSEGRTDAPASSSQLQSGRPSPLFVLMRHRILSLHLEGKGVFFEGEDEPYDVWESSPMMVGWLRVAVDGGNHEIFFVSMPGRDQEGTPCLCDTLEIEPGSALNRWIDEQVTRLWSELPS